MVDKQDVVPAQHGNLPGARAKWSWPAIHPEGRKFILISGVICLVFALMAWETLAWPMAGITIWVAAFFRDPVRVTPQGASLIIAPADGLITQQQALKLNTCIKRQSDQYRR